MPSVTGVQKINKLVLQGHPGDNVVMEVANNQFQMVMGDNVLMTVASDDMNQNDSNPSDTTSLTIAKNTYFESDISVSGTSTLSNAVIDKATIAGTKFNSLNLTNFQPQLDTTPGQPTDSGFVVSDDFTCREITYDLEVKAPAATVTLPLNPFSDFGAQTDNTMTIADVLNMTPFGAQAEMEGNKANVEVRNGMNYVLLGAIEPIPDLVGGGGSAPYDHRQSGGFNLTYNPPENLTGFNLRFTLKSYIDTEVAYDFYVVTLDGKKLFDDRSGRFAFDNLIEMKAGQTLRMEFYKDSGWNGGYDYCSFSIDNMRLAKDIDIDVMVGNTSLGPILQTNESGELKGSVVVNLDFKKDDKLFVTPLISSFGQGCNFNLTLSS